MGNLVNQHVRFIESGEFLTYPKPTGGNSLDRLNERKQMSTKTTFKRIALVAVASLGFGLLTSVAPASADVATVTSVSAGTPAASRVGVSARIPVTFRFAAGSNGDTFEVGARVTSAPAGSKAFEASSAAVVETATVLTTTAVTYVAGTTSGWAAGAAESTANAAGEFDASTSTEVTIGSATATSATVNFVLKADKAGSYSILFWAGGTTWLASYKSSSRSLTTVGAPTSITMTKIGSTIPSNGANGALVAITLKDATGAATRLGLNEALTVSDNSDATVITDISGDNTISALGSTQDLGSEVVSDAVTAGTYFVRILSDDEEASTGTVVLTVTGTGSALPATLTTNTSLSFVAATDDTFEVDLKSTTGYAGEAGDYTTATKTSHTFTLTADDADAAARNFPVEVTTTSGLTYDITVKVAGSATATTADFTVSGAVASTDTSDLIVGGVTIDYEAPEVTSMGFIGRDYVLSALGGTTTWTIQVKDQYGNGMQFQAVSAGVSGRNTVASKTLGVTDANGTISFTHKDVAASTVTATTDTVSFTHADIASAKSATIVYGTVVADKVVVTGGSTADTVAGTTTFPISTGDGAEGGAVEFTATVTDASGNLLAGVPVTFTIDAGSTGAIVKTKTVDYSLSYTTADGKASTQVFGWKAGQKITVTATAGGKSGTGYANFVNDDLDARVLSVTAVGNVATALVVDRFGNPVEGVTVTGSASNGYFGSGTTSTFGTTAANGTVGFVYAGSDNATLTFKIDKTVYTQSADAAGQVGGEDLTAAVAGTTIGTGASLAPAGVNTVTVAVTPKDVAAENAQAATDAAAEATDAANAATDAANAAAEAADAATAAAQDAADAVAALSTQVSEMINALKKQITALTNLVIKIQKKVKA